jgi:predicted dehydrogenase
MDASAEDGETQDVVFAIRPPRGEDPSRDRRASASRGFASIAHIPALRALPQFEIVAVATTRQETAEATDRHYQIPFAFALSPDRNIIGHWPDVARLLVSADRSFSTNAVVVWSRQRRRLRQVMAALPRWRWQPAWR